MNGFEKEKLDQIVAMRTTQPLRCSVCLYYLM